MGGICSLSILGSKSQRSQALDIEVVIWFSGCRALLFPPRVTISHIWTTHETKKSLLHVSLRSENQRPSALGTSLVIWFLFHYGMQESWNFPGWELDIWLPKYLLTHLITDNFNLTLTPKSQPPGCKNGLMVRHSEQCVNIWTFLTSSW